MTIVKFKKLSPTAEAPAYQSESAAGMDLRSDMITTLYPGEYRAILTGIAMQLPPGTEGQVRPRSGLAAKHGITVLNAPGTVDADFRGEIRVVLVNHGQEPFVVNRGDRIAQLVIAPVTVATIEEVNELGATERGEGGFGSTGVR